MNWCWSVTGRFLTRARALPETNGNQRELETESTDHKETIILSIHSTPLRPGSDMQQKTKLLKHKTRIGLELHMSWICQHDVQQFHHLGIKCIAYCHPSLL